ncbi:MAG: CPBP family intramembrane metalloprotease [Candidatus Gracilibacteria bacterium]|nr:CPBP family intramembrane metalloprotease [Candidatus Gracilibacteria bacterium]
MLFIVIVVPITEEVIFRGIILKGLSCHCSSIKAILYSSILFSLFHLNPYQFISSFLGGLFLGHLYLKTNSIIPSIIAHAFFNLFSIVYVNFIYEFIQIPLQSFWLSLTGISLMFTGFLSLFKVLSNLNWSNSTGHLNKR